MRVVLGVAGRRARLLVPGARRAGRRSGRANRRESRRRRRTASRPGGVPRGGRGAVRVLHARADRGRDRPARAGSVAIGGGGSRGALGEPLPMHGLPEDPGRGAPCRRTDGAAVSRLLIDGCEVVVTMDDAGTEIAGGSILLQDGAIEWVGSSSARPLAAEGADVIDGRGTVALPGLVNTHHHLYQTLTRARAREQGLFGWLTELYPVWAGIDAEWERAAAAVGLAELALSGCTTTTDHHYVFPPAVPGLLEAEVEAAAEIGLRFHPCRGSMDLGRSKGGLP